MYQRGPDGLVKDITPIQKIEYMKLITLPPTRTNVVRESMIQLHNVSADCGSKYTIITSNLAIAKVAKQIQCKEQLLSILFLVMFGRFHMEQNVSSAIGKNTEGSGGPYFIRKRCNSNWIITSVPYRESLLLVPSNTHFVIISFP